MQNFPDTLGDVLKAARARAKLPIEVVAEDIGVTVRYLYRIENDHQKPAYDVLCKLIRAVSAPVDLIFYPEKESSDPEIEEMIYMLYRCEKRSLAVIRATMQALLENQEDKDEKAEQEAVE